MSSLFMSFQNGKELKAFRHPVEKFSISLSCFGNDCNEIPETTFRKIMSIFNEKTGVSKNHQNFSLHNVKTHIQSAYDHVRSYHELNAYPA